MVEKKYYTAGEGKHRVELLVSVTGDGLVVQLFGGERTHVGAAALSLPRPSLRDPGVMSCNTIVIPLLGHKDDEIAKPVAERIAVVCGKPVLVVAGMHVYNAGPEDVEALVKNSHEAARMLIDSLTRAEKESGVRSQKSE
ncbi:MAG: hypothetical protein A4E52_01560 [Pelotomaculum sp. PtaB.Bin013]|uniref:Prenylated flavin chaperone LpdD-like domain-containing protein n=1 Tax=Pelotomaculum isophthalicicum JI TaxID=947010 RepID=A0A9X4JUL2_9FIRM|nr:hypothetical protein [Pelotomaculum isophthalicicum]MDF9409475.1 hypothetical protein [Pelotomaculum isophthalicicum JI]OPX86014.1 MAG: hypothetical protein A4E52_01560 [Pelotomaculum sp. PtaB.Bin013]